MANNKFSDLPEDKKKEIIASIAGGLGTNNTKDIGADANSGQLLPKLFKGFGYDNVTETKPVTTNPQSNVTAQPRVNTNPTVNTSRAANYFSNGATNPQFIQGLQQGIAQQAKANPYAFMTPEEQQKVETFANFMRNRGGV